MPDRHTQTDRQTHTQLIWAEPSLERFGDYVFFKGKRETVINVNVLIHSDGLSYVNTHTRTNVIALLKSMIPDTKVQYNKGHLMTSAFLTLTKGQDHTTRSKVKDVEVSAFSECFLSILFYSILFYSILFYSILFYSILYYCTIFNYILFCSNFSFFYSILFYSILYYSTLFFSILFYSVLPDRTVNYK